MKIRYVMHVLVRESYSSVASRFIETCTENSI